MALDEQMDTWMNFGDMNPFQHGGAFLILRCSGDFPMDCSVEFLITEDFYEATGDEKMRNCQIVSFGEIRARGMLKDDGWTLTANAKSIGALGGLEGDTVQDYLDTIYPHGANTPRDEMVAVFLLDIARLAHSYGGYSDDEVECDITSLTKYRKMLKQWGVSGVEVEGKVV